MIFDAMFFSQSYSLMMPLIIYHTVSVCQYCLNKVQQTGCIKKQKLIFPQFWRPEVWDSGVRIVHVFQGLPVACSWPFSPLSSCGLPSVPICILMSSSHKDTGQIRLGTTLTISLNLITSLKALSSYNSHIQKFLGLGF